MALIILLLQCVCMLAASMLVGGLPLMFKSTTSGKRLKAISVFGMGILVGAALTIIIPEGVSTLYESLPADHDHREGTVSAIGISLLTGFALMLLIESLTPHPPHDGDESPISSSPPTPHTPLNRSSSHSSDDAPHRPMPQHLDSRSPMIPKRLHVRDSFKGIDSESNCRKQRDSLEGLNATLGLVIHGAADGIALGASSRSGSGSLGLIVFMAVLVHKGPTALGLTTTLLSLGLTPPKIRRRLVIFSFAAPLGAIITYLIVGAFGSSTSGRGPEHGEVDGIGWWTGIALLFSGGSFLYVATVIQPLSSPDPHEHSHAAHSGSEPAHQASGSSEELGKYSRTTLLFIGMVLPILLSSIVGDHGH